MIKSLVLDLAYHLHTSNSYQKTKHFFYNILENSDNNYKRYVDLFMITLIFISVAILIREVKSHVEDSLVFFNNFVISFIFLMEYILRLWVSSSVTQTIIDQHEHDLLIGEKFRLSKALKKTLFTKLKYIFSFKALIDLFAILPFFHQLRLLRMFILFRVFKLFRYAKSIQTFTSVLKAKKFEFLTLSIFASIVVFVSSVVIYVIEANNPDATISTFFEAVYWSIVTISTVGYGDISPLSSEGRVVAMFVIVAGIGVYSFTTSLIVTSFTEKLDEIKDLKLIDDVSKIQSFYLICGYENISREVAKRLCKNNDVIVLEEDPIKVESAKKDGFIALNYDPGSTESYKRLRIDIQKQVKAILCLGQSDVENVYTALTIRSFNQDIFILSILKNSTNRAKLTFAGVNEIVYDKELIGAVSKEFVGKPVAFEAIHALHSSHYDVEVEELLIDERILESYNYVGEFNNKKYRIVLLGIYRQSKEEFVFNPSDEEPIEFGDYLLVIGKAVFITEFNNYLHTKVS